MTEHPLLVRTFPIRWSTFKSASIIPDVTLALQMAQADVDGLCSLTEDKITFDALFKTLDHCGDILSHCWHCVHVLESTMNDPAIRKAYADMLPTVTSFYSSISLNPNLWKVIKKGAEIIPKKEKLNPVQERLISETVLNFVMGGADLPPDKKERLETVNVEISTTAQQFRNNTLDSTNAYELWVDDVSKLSGLQESGLSLARHMAEEKGQKGKYRFTLQMPSRLSLLRFADSEELRKEIWSAACKIGCGDYDNAQLIWHLIELRDEKAKLLGFRNFSDYILHRRMAKDGKTAMTFIEEFHDKIYDMFNREEEVLKRFVSSKTGKPVKEIAPWDRMYWAEKQRKELFDFDQEQVRPYFSVDCVLNGIFSIANRVYGLIVTEVTEPFETWHPDVRFFRVSDKGGENVGFFYADLYPRESKRQGAWAFPLQYHRPNRLGVLCANIQRPTSEKPALLEHTEATTLFHEFGHMCHFLMSEVEYESIGGIDVAWDFVELPSQLWENWAWEKSALDVFAKHFETGIVIPQSLFDRMLAARYYETATFYMRQLSLGKLDMELHFNYEKWKGRDLEEVDEEILHNYRHKSIPVPCGARGFLHLFGSAIGYASGYYSYLWAEVLEADVFTRFKEAGVMSEKVGGAFRREVLAKGNSEPPDVLFRKFMGRDPDVNSLLRRNGLLPNGGQRK
jgi:oligopeptidase A